MTDKNIFWNAAGRAGLALGCVSIAHMVLGALTPKIGSTGLTIAVSGLLWCLKFGGCIWLMLHFMKKFLAENPEADTRGAFRLGAASALLSALLFSAFYLAWSLFIQPDMFTEAFESVRSSSMMNAASLEMLDEMMPKMPAIGFFTNFFYCWIYGTVLSAILSSSLKSRNPFE